MLQWLMVVTPARADMLITGPTPEELSTAGQHFEYWKRLTEAGQALVVGRMQTTGPETMGIAIFLAENEDAARKICQADPAVAGKVFDMRFAPYKVALLGDTAPFKP